MDLGERTLRSGVQRFDAGKLDVLGATKVMPETLELSRRRGEHVRLKRKNKILRRATASFARDAL